ncbi:MAG: DUF1045 domain-containing protein [Pseudomonadota bacterium]
MSTTRYAVYACPRREHPLTALAEAWLGYSAWSGTDIDPCGVEGVERDQRDAFTRSARKYGFHATLKAPFRLAEGKTEADLIKAVERFAVSQGPASIEALVAKQMAGFSALVPRDQSSALETLAGAAVEAFEPYRAPLSDADMERRLASPLSQKQIKLLVQWGYPYVFEEFRFHFTLGGGVSEEAHAALHAAALRHFSSQIGAPFDVDHIALYKQDHGDGTFRIIFDAALKNITVASRLPKTFTVTA